MMPGGSIKYPTDYTEEYEAFRPLTKSRNYSKAFSASFYKKRLGRCQQTSVLVRDAQHISQHPRWVPTELL